VQLLSDSQLVQPIMSSCQFLVSYTRLIPLARSCLPMCSLTAAAAAQSHTVGSTSPIRADGFQLPRHPPCVQYLDWLSADVSCVQAQGLLDTDVYTLASAACTTRRSLQSCSQGRPPMDATVRPSISDFSDLVFNKAFHLIC
jgi:hypothetical protein